MCKEWETRIGMRGAHKNELTRSPPGQDTQVFFDGCVAEPFDEKTIRDFAQLSDPASYLDVESEVDFVSPSLSPGAIVPEMVFLSDEDVHPRQNNIGQGTEEDEVDVGEEDELSNAGGAAVAYDAGVEEGSESGDDFNTVSCLYSADLIQCSICMPEEQSSHTTGQNNNGRALTAASLQNGLSVKDKDVVDYKVSRFPGWSNEASAASTESSIEDLHRSAGFVATN